MSLTVILAVGVDSLFLENQIPAWQSAGCIVTSVGSTRDAFARFTDGDFDIVLLGQSIPAESRERLKLLIRASGSRVPVTCISSFPGNCDSFMEGAIKEELTSIAKEMGELMATPVRMPASRESKPYLTTRQADVR